MIRDVILIAGNDLKRTLRQRETWIWTFVMPLVFFYFFTAIQTGPAPQSEKKDPLTLVVPDEGGLFVDQLVRRLGELDYEVTRVNEVPQGEEKPLRVLEVPAGFEESVRAGREVELALVRKEGGNSAELDRFRVSRAAYGLLADIVVQAARAQPMTSEAFHELAIWPRALQIDARPAGQRSVIPSGKEQSIPGTMVMFTLVLLLTSGSIGVLIDRRQGLLRRLAATPLTRGRILAGKWLGVFALGIVQLLYAVLVGTFAFRLAWGPDPLFVALVLAFWAAFVASLAMLLANIARTEGQVIGIAILSANVLAALGGCWWPIEVTPRWMQTLATTLPSGTIMNALHRLMLFESGPSGALTALVYLGTGALICGWIAARRFRFQ